MRLVPGATLFVVTALVAGCERVPSTPPGTEAIRIQSASAPAFTRTDPRLVVAHSGERTLEFETGQGASHSLRERIQTDGLGRYSIRPLELVEAGSFEWDAFELQQLTREGYLFRYRDFVVRDPRLFARNWVLSQLPATEDVAGRTCRRYRAERRADHSAYELWVDAETGILLASEQYEPNGQRVARMRYESVDYTPDLSGAIWHVAPTEEQDLDPTLPLAGQVEFRVLEPRLLPAGYERTAAATIDDGAGKTWLRLTYGDGVEPLFFFQALTVPAAAEFLQVEAAPFAPPIPQATSSVVVYRIGAARVIQGIVDGFELMVIGTAPEVELLDMIESALP
jgi:hypothetical protein